MKRKKLENADKKAENLKKVAKEIYNDRVFAKEKYYKQFHGSSALLGTMAVELTTTEKINMLTKIDKASIDP